MLLQMRNIKMGLRLGASNMPLLSATVSSERSHLEWMAAPCPPVQCFAAAGSANSGVHCSNTSGVGTWISPVLGAAWLFAKAQWSVCFPRLFSQMLLWDPWLGLSSGAIPSASVFSQNGSSGADLKHSSFSCYFLLLILLMHHIFSGQAVLCSIVSDKQN